ncbi:hypothetical protein EBU91_05390, partial [bacterium]|nr:hypothetical protein [bacterium]
GRTTGYFKNNPNSLVFRDSQENNYNLLKFSENLYTLYGLKLGQDYTSETDATDVKIRIVLTDHGRKLRVERIDGPDQYLILAEQQINDPGNVALRVACTFTSPDETTRCKIKEFNVYGFSDEFSENFDNQLNYDLAACLQKIQRAGLSLSDSKKIFLGKNNLFVENSLNKSFSNYIKTINFSSPYSFRQTISYPLSSVHSFMDSDNENVILAKEEATKTLRFYRNMGRQIVPEYTLYSTGVSGFAESASIDNNLLFVSTVSSIEVYQRNGYSWDYLNSIQTLSSRPYNIKFKNNNGIISYYDGSIHIFENNGSNVYTSVYYASAISSMDEGFGLSLDIC